MIWLFLKKLISEFSGQLYGYMETFLFWLLQDLGADSALMGLTITVGAASGSIMLLGSTFINKKLGYVNTIVLVFFFYILRFVGTAFCKNGRAYIIFQIYFILE